MAMQNYAKFDSRIEESVAQNSMWYYGDDYSVSLYWGIDGIFSFFEEIIEFLFMIGTGLFFLFSFFFFLYIIISLFSKWWEKTAEEIKKFLLWCFSLLSNIFQYTFLWIKKGFSSLGKHKFLFGIIIILLFGLHFIWGVIDGNSRILKLTKIGDAYVWVDLKNNQIIPPGYFLYSPIKTNFFLSPTNNFDFEIAEVTASTSEELWVTLDYRVGFKIVDEKRLEFYKKYGAKDIKLVSSDIVMPRLLETIKWIIKSYSYKDISSKHNEIKNITIQEANKILKPIGIELQEINILDIRLPDTYLKSKQDLLNAETELKLAEARLETQKKESEKRLLEAENQKSVEIIKAEAIAESNKLIHLTNITPEMLEMKKLEIESEKIKKWDGKLPTSVGKEFDFIK